MNEEIKYHEPEGILIVPSKTNNERFISALNELDSLKKLYLTRRELYFIEQYITDKMSIEEIKNLL